MKAVPIRTVAGTPAAGPAFQLGLRETLDSLSGSLNSRSLDSARLLKELRRFREIYRLTDDSQGKAILRFVFASLTEEPALVAERWEQLGLPEAELKSVARKAGLLNQARQASAELALEIDSMQRELAADLESSEETPRPELNRSPSLAIKISGLADSAGLVSGFEGRRAALRRSVVSVEGEPASGLRAGIAADGGSQVSDPGETRETEPKSGLNSVVAPGLLAEISADFNKTQARQAARTSSLHSFLQHMLPGATAVPRGRGLNVANLGEVEGGTPSIPFGTGGTQSGSQGLRTWKSSFSQFGQSSLSSRIGAGAVALAAFFLPQTAWAASGASVAATSAAGIAWGPALAALAWGGAATAAFAVWYRSFKPAIREWEGPQRVAVQAVFSVFMVFWSFSPLVELLIGHPEHVYPAVAVLGGLSLLAGLLVALLKPGWLSASSSQLRSRFLNWFRKARRSVVAEGRLLWEKLDRPGKRKIERLVPKLVAALEAGDWSDPVLDDRHALHVARAAYNGGRITLGQFTTLVLRWEAFQDFRPEKRDRRPLPILQEGGELTPTAKMILGSPEPWANLKPSHEVGLDEEGLARFKELMGRLPKSERYLWIVHVPPERVTGPKREYWADGYQAVNQALYERAFKTHHLVHPGSYWGEYFVPIVVPSFGIIQASLDAKFRADSVRLLPEFGLTGWNRLLDGIATGGRVFGLQFPGVRGTTYEHGYDFGRFFYSMHDWFHAYAGSFHPAAYRKVFPRIVKVGRRYLKAAINGQRSKAFISFFRGPTEVVLEPEIEGLVRNLAALSVPIQRYKGVPLGQALLEDFGPVYQKGGPGFTSLIVEDMALHPKAWAEFNIEKEIDSMGPEAREVYEQALRNALAARKKAKDDH